LAAVVNDGTGASVWRLDASGTRVEKVAVEVASIEADVALIRGSLAEGDRIISLGAHKVDPARPVRIVETYQSPDS
jgi:multidrug efflux pump subunit AcrA (membrane-fusion protein)